MTDYEEISSYSYKIVAQIGKMARPPMGSKAYKRMMARKRFVRLRGVRPKARLTKRFSGPSKELKFLDTTLAFAVDATAEIPATGQLTLIPQDDTQSGREGRKCIVKSIWIKGVFSAAFGTAGVAQADVAYVYVMQDTQANGAAPAVGDANTGIFTSATLRDSGRTLSNVDRFKILHKFTIQMQNQSDQSAGVTVVRPVEWYTKCQIPIEYDASVTTGALTSIRSNNIFLVAGSAITDDIINFNGICRIRFEG